MSGQGFATFMVECHRYFLRINQYFDGKKTDDEILFRADISRKQLRQVLHDYDEYVSLQFIFLITVFVTVSLAPNIPTSILNLWEFVLYCK